MMSYTFVVWIKVALVNVEINDMYNPTYGEGIVNHVDDAGQLHGTWGSLAAIPGEDAITILN